MKKKIPKIWQPEGYKNIIPAIREQDLEALIPGNEQEGEVLLTPVFSHFSAQCFTFLTYLSCVFCLV